MKIYTYNFNIWITNAIAYKENCKLLLNKIITQFSYQKLFYPDVSQIDTPTTSESESLLKILSTFYLRLDTLVCTILTLDSNEL